MHPKALVLWWGVGFNVSEAERGRSSALRERTDRRAQRCACAQPARVAQATAGTPLGPRPPAAQPITALHICLHHRRRSARQRPPARGCPARCLSSGVPAAAIVAEPRRQRPRRGREEFCSAPPGWFCSASRAARPPPAAPRVRQRGGRARPGRAGPARRPGAGWAYEAARSAAAAGRAARCGLGRGPGAERPRRHHGSERGRPRAARAPPPARLLPGRLRLLLLLRHPAGEHVSGRPRRGVGPGLGGFRAPRRRLTASRLCSTRGKYGDGARQEKFTFALSLVFIQCVINAAFAKLRESGGAAGWAPRAVRL